MMDVIDCDDLADGGHCCRGEVDWNFQRNAARSSIENLSGVRRINNFILVKPALTNYPALEDEFLVTNTAT